MNSVNLVGRLTKEPELRRTQDGNAVCSYSLAVKRPMVKDATDFPECVSWRQSAEYLAKYGHKGDVVAVSGTLQSREWTDKDGKKHKAWEVVTTSVELLSSKKNDQAGGNTTQNQTGYPGGFSQPQQSNQQSGSQGLYYHQWQGNQGQQNGYQQQGFGGYHVPQQNDYPKLDGDDAQMPF